MKLKLKDLLIATGGCLIATLIQILSDVLTPGYRSMGYGLQILLLWFILAVCWCIYLVSVIRKRKKDKEEPWDRKEKDPW